MSGEGNNFFHHWLEPAITPAGGHGAEAAHHASAGVEWGLIILTMTASLIAIFVAQRIYKSSDAAERNAKRFGPIYTLLRNLYWVDEFYELIVLRPFYGILPILPRLRPLDRRWAGQSVRHRRRGHGSVDQTVPDRFCSQLCPAVRCSGVVAILVSYLASW